MCKMIIYKAVHPNCSRFVKIIFIYIVGSFIRDVTSKTLLIVDGIVIIIRVEHNNYVKKLNF